MDPEIRLAVHAEAYGPVAFQQDLVAKRAQRLLVECFALLELADPQADVVDHRPLLPRMPTCHLGSIGCWGLGWVHLTDRHCAVEPVRRAPHPAPSLRRHTGLPVS